MDEDAEILSEWGLDGWLANTDGGDGKSKIPTRAPSVMLSATSASHPSAHPNSRSRSNSIASLAESLMISSRPASPVKMSNNPVKSSGSIAPVDFGEDGSSDNDVQSTYSLRKRHSHHTLMDEAEDRLALRAARRKQASPDTSRRPYMDSPSSSVSSFSIRQGEKSLKPSIFGVDKVMQAELIKLDKLVQIEEAERKMQLERDRVAALERSERSPKSRFKGLASAFNFGGKKRRKSSSAVTMLSQPASLIEDGSTRTRMQSTAISAGSFSVLRARRISSESSFRVLSRPTTSLEVSPPNVPIAPRYKRSSSEPILSTIHPQSLIAGSNTLHGQAVTFPVGIPNQSSPSSTSLDLPEIGARQITKNRYADAALSSFQFPVTANFSKPTFLPSHASNSSKTSSIDHFTHPTQTFHTASLSTHIPIDDGSDEDDVPLNQVVERKTRASMSSATRPFTPLSLNAPPTIGSSLVLDDLTIGNKHKIKNQQSKRPWPNSSDSDSDSSEGEVVSAPAVQKGPNYTQQGQDSRSRRLQSQTDRSDDEDENISLARKYPNAHVRKQSQQLAALVSMQERQYMMNAALLHQQSQMLMQAQQYAYATPSSRSMMSQGPRI